MKKERLLIIIMFIVTLIVGLRLSFLMILKKDYYYELKDHTLNRVVHGSSAPRGRILDRNGNVLVDNMGIKTLIYKRIPEISLEDEIKIASSLAKIIKQKVLVTDRMLREYYYVLNKDNINDMISIDIKDKYIKRLIDEKTYKNYLLDLITEEMLMSVNGLEAFIFYQMHEGYDYQDKVIKNNISDKELTQVNELDLPGIRVDMKWIRKYNYNTCLNELFGNVGAIMQENVSEYLKDGYSLDDVVGVSFLEKSYEKYLRGSKAEYIISEDNSLDLVKPMERGNDLVLNIDINLQMKIESVLKKEVSNAKKYASSKYYNGSYILISNPNDGGIVSLVAYKYDGGLFNSDVIGILTNSYTVGSVVKGASQTVAYKYHVIDEYTKVNDACVKLFSQREKCSWKKLGILNDIDALAYSSNYFQFINAIKVSGSKYKRNMKFNPTVDDFNKYRDVFKSYGLGDKTGIDIMEEGIGITGSKITGDLLLNLTIGQYDTYTPLMLSQYINTLAKGGNKYKLRLGDYIINNKGTMEQINEVELLNTVDISDKYMKRIQDGFRKVSVNGTASSYIDKKYKAASKTGTSETYFDGVKTTTKSFVMYAPYDNPEYTMVIVSPNILAKNNINNYAYPINSRLSRQITNILFEK